MKGKLLVLFLIISTISYGQKDISGMVNCFKQGSKDNCEAIALIKASIAVFGTNKVFEEKRLTGPSIAILLKNGAKDTLTLEELAEAERSADFKLKDCKDKATLDYAVKCYAVMAKEKQKQSGWASYDQGLKYLENDAEVARIYLLLGLEKHVKPFDNYAYVENLCGIVAWNRKHAVYACNGVMDLHGKEKSMSVLYYGRFQVI